MICKRFLNGKCSHKDGFGNTNCAGCLDKCIVKGFKWDQRIKKNMWKLDLIKKGFMNDRHKQIALQINLLLPTYWSFH